MESEDEVTSHPEEVLVTVVLLSLPVGCRAVTVGDSGQSEVAALLLSVRLLQEPDEVLVALLLKSSDG